MTDCAMCQQQEDYTTHLSDRPHGTAIYHTEVQTLRENTRDILSVCLILRFPHCFRLFHSGLSTFPSVLGFISTRLYPTSNKQAVTASLHDSAVRLNEPNLTQFFIVSITMEQVGAGQIVPRQNSTHNSTLGTVFPRVQIDGVLFVLMCKTMGYYLSANAKMTGYYFAWVPFVCDSEKVCYSKWGLNLGPLKVEQSTNET